jgi:hypothetical protein
VVVDTQVYLYNIDYLHIINKSLVACGIIHII